MKKIAGNTNYKKAQYIGEDEDGRMEQQPGPHQPYGSYWKNWMPEKKPGVGPPGGSFLEGYDVSTSGIHTANTLAHVLFEAMAALEDITTRFEITDPQALKALSELNKAYNDLITLIQNNSNARFVMYQKR